MSKKELIIIFIVLLILSVAGEFWLGYDSENIAKSITILSVKALINAITLTVIYYLFERRKKEKKKQAQTDFTKNSRHIKSSGVYYI